jgi:hypothetical protein
LSLGLDATPSDTRGEPTAAQRLTAARVVMAFVAVQFGGPLAGPPGSTQRALDRWYGVHHQLQQHRQGMPVRSW